MTIILLTAPIGGGGRVGDFDNHAALDSAVPAVGYVQVALPIDAPVHQLRHRLSSVHDTRIRVSAAAGSSWAACFRTLQTRAREFNCRLIRAPAGRCHPTVFADLAANSLAATSAEFLGPPVCVDQTYE
jgi:hypothetical protein